MGRGYHLATAFELALKLQELAQLLAHRYSSADFRHGPLALVEPGFPMILVNAAGAVADDIADLAAQVLDLGADTLRHRQLLRRAVTVDRRATRRRRSG